MTIRGLAALMTVVASATLSNPALALYQTPNSEIGIVLNTQAWNPNIDPTATDIAFEAMVRQGYFPNALVQTAQPDDELAMYQAGEFVISLQGTYGTLAMLTHGVTDSIDAGVEGLPTFGYCVSLDSAVVALGDLIDLGYVNNSGPGGAEVVVADGLVRVQNDEFGNPQHVLRYWLELTNVGLERISQPQNAIIYGTMCDGAKRATEWITNGTGVFVGYDFNCPVDLGQLELTVFWGSLLGFEGRTNRTARAAKEGLQATITPASAGDSLVLAPWLIDVFPPTTGSAGNIISIQQAYLEFDTQMRADSADAVSAVRLSGNLRFYRIPIWEQDAATSYSYVEYRLFPTAKGTGTVTVYCTDLRSAGGIALNTGDRDPLNRFVPRDTLTFVYRTLDGIYAVGMRHLTAESGPSGNLIKFGTAWEQHAESFTVERLDDGATVPLSPTLAAVGTPAPGEYQVLDPAGAVDDRYQVVEHQSGGRLDLRYEVFEAHPPVTLVPTELPGYDVDSLATEVDAAGNPGSPVIEGQNPGFYVLIAPDSLTSSLGTYKSVWGAFGVDVGIVPLSQTDAQGGIDGYIQWAYDRGTRYVLLVGDANDAAWWDDPSRWVNGWTWPRVVTGGPHLPSQPERNLIPTTYTADVDSPAVAMSFYTPYYASDLPYADVDGNGTPDVRIGRLPVGSRNEVLAYTSKLIAYLYRDLPPNGPFEAVLTCARDNGSIVGSYVGEDADTITAEIPPWWNTVRATATNGSVWSYQRRETVADSIANLGPDRIVWVSSGAQRDIYANFWRLDQGWSMAHLQPPPTSGRFFVSLGFSCGMANFDQTESYTACDSIGSGTATCTGAVTPIAERLLFDPLRGAVAVVGPSRGSYQRGNLLFAREMTKHLITEGRDLGTAFMLAQGGCLTMYPDYTDLFRSYVLLGDPLLGGPTITAVAGVPPAPRPGLGMARPNPFNPITILPVTISSAGRVHLRIFNTMGRLVRTLLDGQALRAGTTRITWDGRNQAGAMVASGVYFVKMDVAGKRYDLKLVLLK